MNPEVSLRQDEIGGWGIEVGVDADLSGALGTETKEVLSSNIDIL